MLRSMPGRAFSISLSADGSLLVIGDTEGGVTMWALHVEAFSDEYGFAGVCMLSPPTPLVRTSLLKKEYTHNSCNMS